MLDHAAPLLGAVVRAVHAHDIHSAKQKVASDGGIVGGFAGRGDHDTNFSVDRGLTKRISRIFIQQDRALIKIGEGFFDGTSKPGFIRELVERGKNRVERCERVRFQAPKGTKSEPAEIMLQIAQIVPPQAQIVGKISCAVKMTQVDVIQFPAKMVLRLRNIQADRLEVRDDRLNFMNEVPAHWGSENDQKDTLTWRMGDGRYVTMS
jgi:hypothetical protein